MQPKFTILTSSYNNEAYLNAWFNSILIQKYRPLEVVFVNDGCSDGTKDKVEGIKASLEAAGIEFQYIENTKRQHYGTCCKLAFEVATGDYFGFLDSDDALAKGSVEFIMKLYEQYIDIGYIYTQFECWTTDFSRKKGPGFCKLPKRGESLLSMGLKNSHTFSHWRTFSRRVPKIHKLWKEGLRCAVDKYLAYRLEELSRGMFADRICYIYRTNVPGQISKVEQSKAKWKEIMQEAVDRRKRYSIVPFPIIGCENLPCV